MFLSSAIWLLAILLASEAKFLSGQCHSGSCRNGGSCHPGSSDNSHWCKCVEPFTGDRCEQLTCPDICKNGGLCVQHGDDHSCSCPLGFEGRYCERQTKRSVCWKEETCGKNGRCRLTTSLEDFECDCHKGWIGPRCDQPDPCPVGFCSNGGQCSIHGSSSEMHCNCPANFEGERCEHDVNECKSNPCMHGRCVNEVGSFHCICDHGFNGPRCELPVSSLQCTIGSDMCQNGGFCETKNFTNVCTCPPMFEGQFCEVDVDECDVHAPCQNGGTCVNLKGGFVCICPNGFEGDACQQNHDDCSGNPCGVGAECIDGIGMFTCKCPLGRTGVRCDIEDQCATLNPCRNGKCITDMSTGNFTCDCDDGFTGLHCDEDIDECATEGDDLCYNNGHCINTPGSYHCNCNKPYYGRACDQVMSSCEPSPCLNHGTCIDKIDSFVCVCKAGFSGNHCEVHGETCSTKGCRNGGVCDRDVCICPRGFLGMFCEEEGVACGMQTCAAGSVCIQNDLGKEAICGCPKGFYGIDCQLKKPVVESCLDNPCLHGSCYDSTDGFKCHCPRGFRGPRCDDPVDHCNASTCANEGTCVHDINGYVCHCNYPFSGPNCLSVYEPCSANECGRNAICIPSANSLNHTCVCKSGFTGPLCDQDVDECIRNPCKNGGHCTNSFGGFKCSCKKQFTGLHCEQEIDYCSSNPCGNNGTCVNDGSDFRCVCPKGFNGKTCQFDNDVCLDNPCKNGAKCIHSTHDYRCQCPAGFSGRNCQINVDECKPEGLCLNGGTCVDGINSYKCHCERGFTGLNCQTFVDLNRFNTSEKQDKQRCIDHNCAKKANNKVCDKDCNLFACDYDGGDCSAHLSPYSECEVANYCERVAHNGRCDEICNTEVCLFDGFDCDVPTSKCPHERYCEKHRGDGKCDEMCNTVSCGFDGNDCQSEQKTLSGDVILVLLTTPEKFVKSVDRLLMTLSATLRASINIKLDEEGPMVFRWNDGTTGQRVALNKNQAYSVSFGGVLRTKRSSENDGIIIWIQVDVASCVGDCFSDVSNIANYLARSEAKEELAQLGMPIYEAIARKPTSPDDEVKSSAFMIIVVGLGFTIISGFMYIIVQEKRSRKRRMITAPTWFPPTEAQNKQFIQQSENQVRMNLFGSQLDMYNCKRTKLDGTNTNYYHPDGFDGVIAPTAIKPNVVHVKPPQPVVYPDPSELHLQAASSEPIKTPIDPTFVNVRAGYNGRAPIIWLADNCLKDSETLIEDVQKLFNAGADLNMQDDSEETALFVATRCCRYGLVAKLIELGADPCIMNINNSTCLHQAAHNDDVKMVQELLKHKTVIDELNEVDEFDRTALMVSAMNCVLSTKVAETLIKAGADPSFPGDKSARTYKGRTALHYAAQYGNVQMTKFLLSQGANKDAQDLEECTPLFLAAREGRYECVLTLVEAGASCEITDQKERTPKEVAEDQHFTDIAEVLSRNCTSIPLAMNATKTKVQKNTTKNVKRVAAKRKPQPLTPPHSDGLSTPSPSDTFHLGRPLLCNQASLLDSPVSDPMTSHRDKFNSQAIRMSTPYWSNQTSGYMKPSPPYEEQHSEYGLGANSFYTSSDNMFSSFYDTTHPELKASPSFPSCQYAGTQTYH